MPSRAARKRYRETHPRHTFKGGGALCAWCYRAPDVHQPTKNRKRQRLTNETVIAIDGEGQGRNPHLYTYMAAVDEYGVCRAEVENPNGLTTQQCLDFLLGLKARRCFGFSLTYDFTKMLRNLPDETLYKLVHESLRSYVIKGRTTFKAVTWGNYRINYLNRKLTVQRIEWRPHPSKPGKKLSKGVGPTMIVWDVFRFYACKFTKALRDWRIGDPKEVDWIETMKDRRSEFDTLSKSEVQKYCKLECHYLALMVRALMESHKNAGLELKAFYGAGSTATALLTKIQIKEKLGDPPAAMKDALSRSFFGGRFEPSHVGPIREIVYGKDISSAYPYQTTFLPCLAHGRWEFATVARNIQQRIERAQLALIHCVPLGDPERRGWGALPFRHTDGTIVFPLTSGGVWVWKDEALAAQRGWRVQFTEAWLYHTDCDCNPFGNVPGLYLERLRLGKEGAGLILKLGCNSIYGKLAQSKGAARFNSWVWAANITSGTRAQLLDGIIRCPDSRYNVLMFATDGIFSRCPIDMPGPRDTGTDIEVIDSTTSKPVRKPLGGWESKEHPQGLFFARPGIYFPLDMTDTDTRQVKARGVGIKTLFRHRERIITWWDGMTDAQRLRDKYKVKCEICDAGGKNTQHDCEGVVRFVGLNTGLGPNINHVLDRIQKGKDLDIYRKEGESGLGEWADCKIEMSVCPFPKRYPKFYDTPARGTARYVRPFSNMPGESAPYNPAVVSQDARLLKEGEEIMNDCPDGDVSWR